MSKNKFCKYFNHTVRILFGLLFLFSGVSFFFMTEMPLDTLPLAAQNYMGALIATGYFLPLLKITEAVAGALVLSGRFTALGLIILAPIVVNILCVNLFLAPEGLIMGVVLTILTAYLAYTERAKYTQLF